MQLKSTFVNNLKELEDWSQELVDFLKEQQLPFYLLLTGDLGAGKTTLTKMVLKKLGVNERVTSPTFVILNQYQTPKMTINHMDAYRLNLHQDLGLFFEEFEQGLNIIEWPANLGIDWSDYRHLQVNLKIIGAEKREIIIG